MQLQDLCLCLLLAVGSFAEDAKVVVGTTVEQELCTMMADKFNTFVDMVPIIIPITFPSNNDYFIGSSEVIFYPAIQNDGSPQCTVLKDKNLTLFRISLSIRIAILNEGSRMDISTSKLDAYLRLQKYSDYLTLDPQMVDVQITGDVFRDGVKMDDRQADEILRPTLIKGFTDLAAKHLSYSGSLSEALYVDPSTAASLFKQLLMSYIAQIIQ